MPSDALSVECAATNNHADILALLLVPCSARTAAKESSTRCTCDTGAPGAPHAVYIAAWHAYRQCVQVLLGVLCDKGRRAVWAYRALDGGGALHAAALGGDVALVKVLLEGGAEKGVKDGVGRLAVDLAKRFVVASGRGEEVVQALEEGDMGKKVDARAENRKGQGEEEGEKEGEGVYCLVERVEGMRLGPKACHPV